jgi:hypothetical protein
LLAVEHGVKYALRNGELRLKPTSLCLSFYRSAQRGASCSTLDKEEKLLVSQYSAIGIKCLGIICSIINPKLTD